MSESEKPRILVIDDDEDVRKVIAIALSDAGYVAHVASTGQEAIARSQETFYNLALVDIRLPDMEGIELLTAMRQTTPKMIRIILTGYPALENTIEAVNRGADGYMTKPVNIGNLLHMIEKRLESQREQKEYGQKKLAEFVETRFRELSAQEAQ